MVTILVTWRAIDQHNWLVTKVNDLALHSAMQGTCPKILTHNCNEYKFTIHFCCHGCTATWGMADIDKQIVINFHFWHPNRTTTSIQSLIRLPFILSLLEGSCFCASCAFSRRTESRHCCRLGTNCCTSGIYCPTPCKEPVSAARLKPLAANRSRQDVAGPASCWTSLTAGGWPVAGISSSTRQARIWP